ncbi:MAG: hypothetical protein OEZ18_00760 [Candidatus Bathyarchaeota archaeon]|nr:hypothetical protein [Candidatus Bathyarchaeota archaeon]
MEELWKIAEILNKQLGLSPYESRAYVSLIIYGPMSPSELARKSDIPRPRTYDVLRNLMEKGMLMEQSGKPSIYAALEPEHGLKNLEVAIETETLKQLQEKKGTVQTLTKLLSQAYEKSKHFKIEKSKVWFTQRDTAFISLYSEAIRGCKREFLVASTSLRPPEKEIVDAVHYALRKGVSIRVVRQITDLWTLEELEKYEALLKAGSQVRSLDVKENQLRFMIFDGRDVILVFPSETEQKTPQTLEALWLRNPPLAKILKEYHKELWNKGKPILPILQEIKKKKQEMKGSCSP